MSQEKETLSSILKRLSSSDIAFWVSLILGVIFGFLKILSILIKHRDVPITIGMVAATLFGAAWFFIALKKLNRFVLNFGGHGCEGCLFTPLLAVVWCGLIPMVLWHLAFWLMGLTGFLSQSEVESFVLLAL